MSGDTVPTFEEFAAEQGMQPRLGGCRVCQLPTEVRAQLDVAQERGFRSVPMHRYLVGIGISHVSSAMLNNHMVRGHSW